MNYNEVKDLEQRILNTPFGVIQKAINCGKWDSPAKIAMKYYLNMGACMLAERHYFDNSGKYYPARDKVKAGSVGSPQYVKTWFPVLLQEMEEELMILN
jgi:hypothetical protein